MAYNSFPNSPSYSQFGSMNHANPTENGASSYTPPYPAQYGPEQVNMPQPQVPPTSASPTGYYPKPPYEPAPWQQQQHQQQQPPPPPPPGRINEAVNSAFRQADSPAYLSPEVVSQITATVIQQLKATGLDNLQSDQQPSPPPPPQWSHPATAAMYGEPSHSPRPQNTPPPPPKIPQGNPEYQAPVPPVHPSSPHIFPGPSVGQPGERRGSPTSQSQVSDHHQSMESRPKPPSREATVTEMTTLDKVWGKFFEDGKPTEKLSMLLRGIAVHLIENYPPENTLVVVPEKMKQFYADTSVSSDPYPWEDIFDDRTSQISRLLRRLEVEHHLVQNKLHERPDIPGLTPRGFARWATLMIQAHPEKEYERFQKALLNMPINNPDNRSERLPKEFSRRLFPDAPDLSLREEIDQKIMEFCNVDLPPITEDELKKVAAQRHKKSAHKASVSSVDSTPSMGERERQPYYSTSSSAIVDDEDKEVPSRPIERERKPYTAHPGGGKVYEDKAPSHRHANSMSAGSGSKDGPIEIGPRMSETHLHTGTSRPTTTFGRSRSPSRGAHTGGDYRHSESDLLGHGSGSRYGGLSDNDYYYPSTTSALPGDIDDSRKYHNLSPEHGDRRLYDALRNRDSEREKLKRSSWGGDEDYYRAATGYDYKPYGYR
ncbi:hypothetical protein ASPTUDRAFT_446888 [Aspergillus tubingensis CBS 134.48]|uniref:DUF7514 domain-containing protein n=1 Tax=Aspergillus tubingensis (strain CBS 134.48) TaxID=767770 RepID=A0A1L9N9Z7_ASPTC|nr:hypothetical protein ASPTUDRAFT_446888 [Aspergillus tubingensis CBS 134.48]